MLLQDRTDRWFKISWLDGKVNEMVLKVIEDDKATKLAENEMLTS